MAVPKDIQEKADRRIFLWHKNKGVGLTNGEIEEYKRLTRSVNAFIKKTWPESWESVKFLSRRRRMVFKHAPVKKKPATLLKEKIVKWMEK